MRNYFCTEKLPEISLALALLLVLSSPAIYTFYNSELKDLKDKQRNKFIYTLVIGLLFLILRSLRYILRSKDLNIVCFNVGFPIKLDVLIFCFLAACYFKWYRYIILSLLNTSVLQNLFFFILRLQDSLNTSSWKVQIFCCFLLGSNLSLYCLVFLDDIFLLLYVFSLWKSYNALRDLITEHLYLTIFSHIKTIQSFEEAIKVHDFNGEALFLSLTSSTALILESPLEDKVDKKWKRLEYNYIVKQYIRSRAYESFRKNRDQLLEVAKSKPEVVQSATILISGGVVWGINQRNKALAYEEQNRRDEERRVKQQEECERLRREEQRQAEAYESKMKTQKLMQDKLTLEKKILEEQLEDLKKPKSWFSRLVELWF